MFIVMVTNVGVLESFLPRCRVFNFTCPGKWEDHSSRALLWRLLLDVIPRKSYPSLWGREMSRKRDEYRCLKSEHRIDIAKVRGQEGCGRLALGARFVVVGSFLVSICFATDHLIPLSPKYVSLMCCVIVGVLLKEWKRSERVVQEKYQADRVDVSVVANFAVLNCSSIGAP